MNKQLSMKFYVVLLILVTFVSCKKIEVIAGSDLEMTAEMKAYWYNNAAEITSYSLVQARYGELREGKAVMIFVTEPFSQQKFVKADNPTSKDITVLKLNFTKNFTTGIYPYSMMNSTFYPVNGENSVKISSSSQEWCGHTYMELLNKEQYEISLNSYFEGESFENLKITKDVLEDDLWSMIRLHPKDLPIGNLKVIPSFFYLRLMHKETKSYDATVEKASNANNTIYTITYPELNRSLSITFENSFPNKIKAWKETYPDGFGDKKEVLTTTGTLLETVKTDYWKKNKTIDLIWRDKLELD
jgi:hypothetical protein